MEHELPTTPATSAELETYRHAPTLLAGQTAGSGGQVKVWTPTWKEIWKETQIPVISGVTLALLLAIWDIIGHRRDHSRGIFWLALAGCSLLTALLTRLNMPYVTTDDAGIGLTTLKGSEAFRWNEIRSVESTEDWFHPLLRFDVGQRKPVTCNMLGHSIAARQELLDLITEKAHLVRDGSKTSKFFRSRRVELPPSTSAALPPVDRG